jgi:hypothetical protein
MQQHNRATSTVVSSVNDAKGGFDMKKYLVAVLVAVMATIFVASGKAATKDACPAPFGPNFTCSFQPATVVSTSHTHIVVHSTVKKDVKTYEKITGHVAAIAIRPKGISPKGCIDPIALGQIQAWGDFENSGSNIGFFWTHWNPKWRACGEHKVRIGGHLFWKFRKKNCGNEGLIPIGEAPAHDTVIVDEFRTTTVFYSVYDKIVTSSIGTTFVCKNPGFPTLTIIGGKGWCFIAIQLPSTPTQPGPTPTCPSGTTGTPPNCVIITVSCPIGTAKDSAGNCVAIGVNCPSGTVKDSNGNCVVQTNTAALNCEQTAQSLGPNTTWTFNNNTLTCQIIQINGQCSNITVIIGNGSPVVHQEGNCNTAPPPPATPPKPVITDVQFPQGQGGVLAGNSYTVCGFMNATVQSGKAAVITIATGTPGHPGYGNITNLSPTTQVGTGQYKACATYTAPGEQVTDTITVYGTDGITNADPVTAPPWQVQPQPPRPMWFRSDNANSDWLVKTGTL